MLEVKLGVGDSLRAAVVLSVNLSCGSVTLKATEQPIDTSTAAGKCFLDMLGVFAEFETNLRKERQARSLSEY
jgi:DNA invertase Pin-like site-specific DNA recombinase